MQILINIVLLVSLSSMQAKVTYFNLENTYGPYCNPNNKFTPDAGIIRYAGTPWIGKCVLNIQSYDLPMYLNGSLIPNLSISTRFYLHLIIPPLCLTEDITIQAGSGETIAIDCNTKNGSEYFFDTENVTFTYYRTSKLPLSKFLMILTPLKIKTRMYSACEFDCFSDTFCIDRSLVCDRYKNCPNGVDESNCEYSHHHQPLSFRSKILLLIVLILIISSALSSILICYFCCEANNKRLSHIGKERKSFHQGLEETGAVATPLLSA